MRNTGPLLVSTILGITAITTAIQTKCSEEFYTDIYCVPEYETNESGKESCYEFGLNLPWRNTSNTKNDGTIEVDFNFPSHMCNYTKFKVELTVNYTIEKESCTNIKHSMENISDSVAILEICNDKCENTCKKFQKKNDTTVSIPFKHISTGCYQLAVTAYTNTIAEQSITVRRYHATDYKFNLSAAAPTKQCSYYEDSDIVDYTFTLSNSWIMKYIKIEKWKSSVYSIPEEKQHYRIDVELPNRINTCLLKNNVDADSALLNCSITRTNSQAYNLECKFTKDILGHYFILKYKDPVVCPVYGCLNIDNSTCIKKIRGIEPPEKDQENSKVWLIVTIICIIVIVSAIFGGAHKLLIEKFRKVLDSFFDREPLIMEQKQKILLLYLTDCPLFMDFASKLRKLLSKINDGKVYDLHDPHQWDEINVLTENWILTKIHDPSMKFVIIEPRTAIRNRTLPSNSLDEYYHFALKCLSRNIDEINSIRILICRLEIKNNCEYAKYAFMNPFVRINLPSNLDRLLTFACINTIIENDSELDQAKNECFECFKEFTDFLDRETIVEINL